MLTQSHSLVGIIDVVRRWRLPVLLATLAALLISAVISLMLPNEYGSTAVFLPTNLASTNTELLFEGQKVEVHSTSEDIDRIITIGESQLLAEQIINKFNLFKVYGIDTAGNINAREDAYRSFSSNYNITQNSRDAIEVSFMAKDPKLAAAVSNEIVNTIDRINQELTFENRKKVIDIYHQRYKLTHNDFRQAHDSLLKIRKRYGIYHQERQIWELTRQVAQAQADVSTAEGQLAEYSKHLSANDPKIVELKAKISGGKSAIQSLTKPGAGNFFNLEDFAVGADYSAELSAHYLELQTRMIGAKAQYETAKVALTGKVSTLYIVQKAIPPTRKAKPVRWLIVVTSTLFTFFACTILISLYEVYRKQV
jgi:uncharacterized protein involved in exopolysaccharide biosynthesis